MTGGSSSLENAPFDVFRGTDSTVSLCRFACVDLGGEEGGCWVRCGRTDGCDACEVVVCRKSTAVCACVLLVGVEFLPRNGLFPSGKEQSGLPLGNNVFAVGVAERAEGFKTSWRIDGG